MSKQCAEQVLRYLEAQNRPYSANDVTQNLHGEHSKALVTKALESLAAEGRVAEKENGKQRVYCCLQQGGAEPGELQQLDASIASVRQNLSAVEQQARESETQARKLLDTPTTEAAEAEVAALDIRLQRLREKLADITDNCIKVSPQDRQRVTREHDKMLREYRKRKRICTDAMGKILDGYNKSKADFIEEVGIETDEAAGVKL